MPFISGHRCSAFHVHHRFFIFKWRSGIDGEGAIGDYFFPILQTRKNPVATVESIAQSYFKQFKNWAVRIV